MFLLIHSSKTRSKRICVCVWGRGGGGVGVGGRLEDELKARARSCCML